MLEIVTIALGSLTLVSAVYLLLRKRRRRYRFWFRVPARRCDYFNWHGSHRELRVIADVNGFDLPPNAEIQGKTVFLRLTVRAPVLGWLLDPYIEIHTGQQAYRQYFERGANGQRYLNLSPLFGRTGHSPAPRVCLRGSLLRWAPEAWLQIFEPPDTDGATVLVLAPHPDDAEIAAFGMYASHRSWVVTITAGELGGENSSSHLPPPARLAWNARLRVWDSLSVPKLGRVPADRAINLVYPDRALESMFREPSRVFKLACADQLDRSELRRENPVSEFSNDPPACTWHGLVGELRSLLELTQPQIVICPHPTLDTHPDHIYTTVALEQAMHLVAGKRPLVLLYAVHSRDAPLFPFGPATSLIGLPPGNHAARIADSVFSHALPPQVQQAKYFAVEAMHDLRAYPDVEPRDTLKVLRSIRKEISARVAGLGLAPASLLRRSPRPNEIFYVVSGDLLSELVRQL